MLRPLKWENLLMALSASRMYAELDPICTTKATANGDGEEIGSVARMTA